MSSESPKVFSLAEANALVPKVAEFTAHVVRRLDGIRQRYRSEATTQGNVPEWVLREVESILGEWSEQVAEIGAQPKGYFTVDFQSVDPELLYCWTYGEDKIAYTHKVWENFTHRRKISSSVESSTDHLKWVN